MMGGWLTRKVVEALLGKVADSLTGGDPLAVGRDEEAEEPRERDPVFPLVRVGGKIPREAFREVVELLDARLERGFRETQKEVLCARSGKLPVGGDFVLLCNVFHGGVPSGLQIFVLRADGVHNLFAVEGRGPAMQVVSEVLKDRGVLVEAERDGVFHRGEGGDWEARLPAAAGTFLGQEVAVVVEVGWPGFDPEVGPPGEAPFVRSTLESLGVILAGAERGFERFVEDPEVLSDVSDPVLVFPRGVESEEQWYLQVSRSNWPGFRWQILFVGDRAVNITAGR